jgi:hypothetical protein
MPVFCQIDPFPVKYAGEKGPNGTGFGPLPFLKPLKTMYYGR